MPVVDMQRLVLLGNNKERKELMKTLHRLGCVEINKTHDIANTADIDMADRKEEVQFQLARLQLAFDVIKEKKNIALQLAKKKTVEYKAPKKEFFPPKPEVEFEDFIQSEESRKEVMESIDRLSALNNEYIALKSEETKYINLISLMAIYKDIDVPLSVFEDTKNVSVTLGHVPSNKIEALKAALDGIELCGYAADDKKDIIESDKESNKYTSIIERSYSAYRAILVTCFKTERDKVQEVLSEYDFTPVGSATNSKAQDVIDETIDKLIASENRRNELVLEIAGYEKEIKSYRLMYDYYTIEADKVACQENMKSTGTSYILEGWIPKASAERVDKTLSESSMALSYVIRDAVEGEIPPTLVVDNAVVTPYESVTNMFSVPSYKEINPNPFLAFFFFLFFGIMVSDAGYGILMTLATGIVLLRMKPKKYDASLIKIIFMGGISTIFWGIMFGSYFGEELLPAIMFNPLTNPIGMLVLSLAMGMFQMLVGMGINAYALFKQKKPLDAIFGVFSWYVLFIGIAFLVVKASWAKYVAIGCIAAGLVGLMIAGAIHAKGVRKLTGAFGKLYGIVNFFSDLLSYTRLFGLGLSTGVIAMVLNQIAGVIAGLIPVLGIVIAAALLVFGHLFNIGINTLGAYVHNSRLQFIEFFGKFYAGGGRLFAPLGSNMKYYNVTITK